MVEICSRTSIPIKEVLVCPPPPTWGKEVGYSRREGLPKESVLVTSVQKHMSYMSTLYDPRIGGTNKLNFEKVAKLQESLSKINLSIGFAHVIPSLDDLKFTNTKFGPQAVGSPLAYHLAPTPFNFEIKEDLLGIESICPVTEKDFVNVPLSLVNSHGIDIDKVYSDLSEDQKQFLSSLEVSSDEANRM